MEKVAIFVDVQNVYYTVRETFSGQFDYTKFWAKATAGREVVRAIAYATDRNDPKQQAFQRTLQNIGFEIKLRPVVQRRDGTSKADWDVGITIDVLELARDVDVAVLVSGDGDFDLLVKKMQDDYKTRMEVYGVEELSGHALVQAADKFIAIDGGLLLLPKAKRVD